MYKLLIVPPNPKLPSELQIPTVTPDGDLVERLILCKDEELLFPIGDRELQLLIEFRDVIPLQIRALIGLPNTEYDAVWSTYAASLDRVTIDNIEYELRTKADQRSDAGQTPETTPVTRSALLRRTFVTDEDPDEDEDEVTGEIS